ncbi:N-acetyltransferase [Vibrio sp. Of14-4]|uniref:acyltransferase n=1 Tax=Vibrio sp. Of14-4 TaxID=2724878 RepID=UPI001EF246C9|nr:acyltransferase [Vibrio sp. Of14-4]MCG7489644.1 N-acetyltransferase [Vibrio sp. Of14-4]
MNNRPKLDKSRIKDVSFGCNVRVIKPSNIYGCSIGNNTFVGPFVEIQKGVVIGENCKIQSHSFICELVNIGDDVFIGHGVMFINDLFSQGFPANGNKDFWLETKIENKVSVGSNATILPVRICSNVVIGAGAVVTKDINEPGVYVGNPAKKIRGL